MPKNLTDASVFTSAISVPVDADPANAASVEVPFQGLADRTRWLRNYCTDFGVQLPAAVQPSRYIGPQSALLKTKNDGTPEWRPRSTGSAPDNFDGVLRSDANFGELYVDLTPRLVRGGTVAHVRALVRPGATLASRGGATNGINAALVGVSAGLSFASPAITATVIGHDEDDGTTDLQWLHIDLTPGGVAVATHVFWYLRIYAGADAATNRDYFYGVQLEVASSTIRND